MNLFDNKQGNVLIALLLFACFVLFFFKVGDRDLWAPDEDEYAQISREMLRTDNWLYPTVNGEPWTIKPVLYNWLVSAVSLPWGDVDEFRARIFSALAALGTVLVTFQLGKLAFSPLAGFLGALVLATNVLFLHQARWAQTYMLSTFFATLAIFLFYRGYRSEEKRRLSYLLMYAAVGLGVLTMGPVNLAVPGLVIFFYLVFEKDLRHILRMRLGWGILIFLLISLPWYTLMSMHGEYVVDLLIKTNLSRYFDTYGGHVRPFYYYVVQIAWSFMPWSLLLPGAVHLAFSQRSQEDRKALKFLLIWCIGLFVFYSISRGKRAQYILPLYPALALLVGYLGDKASAHWQDPYYRRAVILPSLLLAAGAVLLAIAMPVGTHLYFKPMFRPAIGAAIITGVFGVLLWIACKKDKAELALFLPAAFIAVIIFYSTLAVIPKVDEYKSPRSFCEEIVARLNKGADWAMYRFYRATYVYYTDSFAKVFETEEQLNGFLDRPTRTLVAMRENEYDKLNAAILKKTHVIYRKKIGHRPMILISNQAE